VVPVWDLFVPEPLLSVDSSYWFVVDSVWLVVELVL
jgi:hypothetical protein